MNQTIYINIDKIDANIYQPRQYFDDTQIVELAESIKENGLIQPIVVRELANRYQIIAGERRFRACKLLSMDKIACIVIDKDDLESAQLALVENIQRENLTAIEEARAYVSIMSQTNISQSELAKKMGKSQSAVANKIRLLNLPQEVIDSVNARKLSERHARALLQVEASKIEAVAKTIIQKGYTVSQSEQYIKEFAVPKKRKSKTKGYSGNVKIGINTVQQAINMCVQAKINTTYKIDEDDKQVKVTIIFSKEEN